MADPPLVRIKIIQAVPDILRETEGDTLVGHQDEAEGDTSERQSLSPEITERLLTRKRYIRKGFLTEVFQHR